MANTAFCSERKAPAAEHRQLMAEAFKMNLPLAALEHQRESLSRVAGGKPRDARSEGEPRNLNQRAARRGNTTSSDSALRFKSGMHSGHVEE